MKKYFLIVLAMFFLTKSLYSQENQLTTQQKVKDFLYSYQVLEPV